MTDLKQSAREMSQADALLRRLMVPFGGSLDAYEGIEEPAESPVSPPEEISLPERVSLTPAPSEEDDDVCLHGLLQLPEDGIWTNPDPISAEYENRGLVEDSPELDALWKGFRKAWETGLPQKVQLDSGEFEILRPGPRRGFELWDPIKNRMYIQETNLGHQLGESVGPNDLFIWVTLPNNRAADLGYIHEGYTFTKK